MSRPPSVDESPFFSPFSFVAESPTPGGVLLTLESDIRGVNERINFLDPELQTAANRIEILETLSHGNSDRIQTLADQFSRHIRHLDSLLHRNESLGESQSSQSLPPPPLPPKNSPSPTPPKPESKPKPKPKPKPQPSTKPKRKKRPEHFFPLSPPPRRSAPQGPSVLLQFHDDITKVIERLNFLDPELKSACNRIEILETLSHGNSERLQSLLELLSVSERRLQSLQELEVAGHGSYYQLYYDATLDDTTERREEANTEELHLFSESQNRTYQNFAKLMVNSYFLGSQMDTILKQICVAKSPVGFVWPPLFGKSLLCILADIFLFIFFNQKHFSSSLDYFAQS